MKPRRNGDDAMTSNQITDYLLSLLDAMTLPAGLEVTPFDGGVHLRKGEDGAVLTFLGGRFTALLDDDTEVVLPKLDPASLDKVFA